MNKQEIFDTVARHIFKQGVPGGQIDMANNFSCQYRGSGGTSCAVGCLIPDDSYRSSMEGNDVEYLLDNYDVLPSWMGKSRGLLVKLQVVHDFLPAWRSASAMRIKLHRVAMDYNLDSSLVDELYFPADRELPIKVQGDD